MTRLLQLFARKRTIILAIFTLVIISSQFPLAYLSSTVQTVLRSSGNIIQMQSSSSTSPSIIEGSQIIDEGGSLHVEGNQILNEAGKPVLLRGWNKGFGGDTDALIWGEWNTYQQSKVDQILDKMQSYGANVVRQFITVNSWIQDKPVSTELGTLTYRECINDLLMRASNREIYVIITPHGIYPKDCPVHGWSGCIYQEQGPFDPYTTDGHEGILPDEQAFARFIGDIIEEHGYHTNLIIEPWNEPFWGYSGDYIVAVWQSAWQRCINSVRTREASRNYVNHLIVIQFSASLGMWDLDKSWMNFNWYWSHLLEDVAGNLIYSSHAYAEMGKLGTPKPSSYSNLLTVYHNAKLDAISAEVPVIIGEIGASLSSDHDPSAETEFLRNSLVIFNELEISYVGWAWWDAGTIFDMIQTGTEATTGGTVNNNGQLLVEAMNS